MARNEERLEFDGYVVHQTDAAVKYFVIEADEEMWFPLSQIQLDDGDAVIRMPHWLAEKKGLV